MTELHALDLNCQGSTDAHHCMGLIGLAKVTEAKMVKAFGVVMMEQVRGPKYTTV